MIEDLELTDVLNPTLFDSHQAVINALYEVYFEMGERYLEKLYDPASSSKIQALAQDNVEKKYGIGRYSDKQASILTKSGMMSDTSSQDRQLSAKQGMEDAKMLIADTKSHLNQRPK
mmetsp:Transcript_2610/g.4373  ORF Transcript_2610/g.4373 Transcript_2610/m.4373 type:complete len:117 (-) Transcript_2610:75-425(-)